MCAQVVRNGINNSLKQAPITSCTDDIVCVPNVAHCNGLLESIQLTVVDHVLVNDGGSRLAYKKNIHQYNIKQEHIKEQCACGVQRLLILSPSL